MIGADQAMKQHHHHMFQRIAYPLLCALLLASNGCLGDDFEACPEQQRVIIPEADARIWPPRVYTGYNGRDVFLAPISVNFMADDWRASNGNVATVSPLPLCASPSILDPSAVVTTTGAGTTQVTAIAPNFNKSVEIVVTEYSVAQTDAGERRYREESADPLRRPCAGCHEQENGVDHTPLEMAFHDDAAILEVSVSGRYPDVCTTAAGAECECGQPECVNTSSGYVLNVPHEWTLTPEEEQGIVAYMRSLRPSGL